MLPAGGAWIIPAGKPIKPAGISRRRFDEGQIGTAGVFAKDFVGWIDMPERYGSPGWSYDTFVISSRSPKRAV
jgi:hypothetical protein